MLVVSPGLSDLIKQLAVNCSINLLIFSDNLLIFVSNFLLVSLFFFSFLFSHTHTGNFFTFENKVSPVATQIWCIRAVRSVLTYSTLQHRMSSFLQGVGANRSSRVHTYHQQTKYSRNRSAWVRSQDVLLNALKMVLWHRERSGIVREIDAPPWEQRKS